MLGFRHFPVIQIEQFIAFHRLTMCYRQYLVLALARPALLKLRPSSKKGNRDRSRHDELLGKQ